MGRRNYFEILGLAFDPAESNMEKIRIAIEEWEKKIKIEIQNDSDPNKKNTLQTELVNMKVVMNDPEQRKEEAKTLKNKRLEQLEQIINIMLMGQSGKIEVTEAMILHLRSGLGLKDKDIKNVFKRKNIEIILNKKFFLNLKDEFLDESIFEGVKNDINNLHSLSESRFPWKDKVKNLYDFVCFLSRGTAEEAESYSKKDTETLLAIVNKYASEYGTDTSEQGHILNAPISKAQSNVFKNEESRKKYDQSLKLEKLKDFFNFVKSAPERIKRDSFFADKCIKKIQEIFPDYSLALTLYNVKAGILADPYEPMKALVHVLCGNCGAPNKFETHQEAERGKCAACGAELYLKCPKCEEINPSSVYRCKCGFVISEIQHFDEYLRRAKLAISDMDFLEAKKLFEKAKYVYPKHPEILSLGKRISEEEKKYLEPLRELQSLISQGMCFKARKKLEILRRSMPKLNLDRQDREIEYKIAEAGRMMPSDSLSLIEKANRCVEIQQIVRDYQPALDILMACKPRSPLNLKIFKSDIGCMLSWEATGDRGITYQVVRKANGVPGCLNDGKVLVDNYSCLSYKDDSLEPGVSYAYAVFACRSGASSLPAVEKVTIFPELGEDSLTILEDSNRCKFSWVKPKNCIGVRVLRRIDSEKSTGEYQVVAAKAISSFEDTTAKNGNTYHYKLQCIYSCGGIEEYSSGVVKCLTPEVLPVPLKNVKSAVNEELVTISWDTSDSASKNVLVKRLPSDCKYRNLIGKVLPISQMNTYFGTSNVVIAQSKDLKTQFRMPKNQSWLVAVICMGASKGIVSNILIVSTVQKCEIDKQKTQIFGNSLRIFLSNAPNYLEKIHYVVAGKRCDRVKWATAQDAEAGLLKTISAEDYKRDGVILVEPISEEKDLYISVVGQYRMPNGIVVYSEASKLRLVNMPKQKLSYHFEWEKRGFFHSRFVAKGCKLVVISKADWTPEIYVVYMSNGRIPLNLADSGIVKIHVIPEFENGFPDGKYVCNIQDDIWANVPSGVPIRLLAQDNYTLEFSFDTANCKMPEKE